MRIAWVVLGLAACGGGGANRSQPADGGSGAPDGPPYVMPDSDLPGGPVTLTFATVAFDMYGPTVFCRDASGGVVQTITLTQSATPIAVTCSLPAGGSVDVLTSLLGFAELTSFRDVAGGDTIAIVGDTGPAQTADGTTMTFTTPSPAVIGSSSCGAFPDPEDAPLPPTTTWPLPGTAPCDAAPIDLLFFDDANVPTQFIWQPGVTYAPGTTRSVGPWQPMTTATIDLANVPAGLGELGVELETRLGTSDTAFSYTFASPGTFLSSPAAGARPATLAIPGTAGRGSRIRLESDIGNAVVDEREIITTDALDGLTLDLAEQPLPIARAAHADGDTIRWTETGSGTGDLRYVYATREPVASGGPAIEWRIFSDPADGARAQTIYPLPDAYASLDWTRGTSFVDGASVTYVDSDQAAGWAEAKARPAQIFDIEYGFGGTASRGHRTISY